MAEANPDKVQLIAINVDGDKVDTKAVVAKRQLTLPVIKDQLKITAERYQLIGTPTSFVITPEGNIQAKYEGANSRRRFRLNYLKASQNEKTNLLTLYTFTRFRLFILPLLPFLPKLT